MNQNSGIKFLRLPQVLEATGLKRALIYYMVKDGEFPKPIKIGKRAVAWIESEVQEWIRDRIKESRST